MLHIAYCWLLVARCMPFVLILSAAIVDEMPYMFHVFCILLLLQGACCVLQAASLLVYFHVQQHWTTRYIPLPVPCFWLLALWLHTAYSLPMLLVACYPPLVAR